MTSNNVAVLVLARLHIV